MTDSEFRSEMRKFILEVMAEAGGIWIPPPKPEKTLPASSVREDMKDAFAIGWEARNNRGKLTEEDVTSKVECEKAWLEFLKTERIRPGSPFGD